MAETETRRPGPAAHGDSLPFFPYRFMAVDCGSNSIKYRVWEIEEDGAVRQLAERRFPVRLGEGVFLDGMLKPAAIKGAVEAFKAIRLDHDTHQIHALRAVATSAMREASNRQTLVREVLRESDIRLEVLPDAEEARMIALGVLGVRQGLSRTCVMIDIGGGSTELIVARDPDIISVQSLRLGAVRLREMFFTDSPPAPEQVELAVSHIEDVFERTLHLPELEADVEVLGSAGTITALRDMAAGTREGGESDAPLTLAAVESLVERMRVMDKQAIVDAFGVEPQRAEVILAGALVLRSIMRRAGLTRLSLVKGGVGDGLLQNFLELAGLRRSRLFDHERAFLGQALALGEHYHFQRHHAEQVARLALRLFDQLGPLHGLGREQRVLLHGAALLHEIGQYVAFSAHHKHAQYLIMNSDLAGIGEASRAIVACVARYHRKAHPKPEHPVYDDLAPADRETVRRLAAILRIADALDREQQSLVSDARVEIGEKRVVFHLAMNYRAQIEIWHARQKGALFEEVFRRELEFRVV